MKKILLVMLLLVAVALYGCDSETKQPVNNVQNTAKQEQVVQKEISVKVYRAAADGTEFLLPEAITLPGNDKSAAENALIALVSTKPQDAKFADVIPIGTKVLGLKVTDGLAEANFSKELASINGGSYDELMACYAIVNTLTEFPEIKKVQILIEGEKKETLSGHMDIDDPLTRNKTLIKE